MNYNNGVSRLGFGAMRLSKDPAKSENIILKAIDQGINYFDTAYIYPGNEEMLGKVMAKYGIRDKMLIASKSPHYLIKKAEDIDRIFNESLKRLGTDHIDYYLMHMLPDVKTWERMKSLGIEEWINEKKKSGAIGKIGFSYHGGTKAFKELIDAYPWEFTQVQYNYMDENSQAGREGVRYAAKKQIPVFIMEPLRGGLLVDKLPKKAKSLIDKYNSPHRSPAEWALKWLWDQQEVSMVLSGMKEESMVDENVRIEAETEIESLTDKERAFYDELVTTIRKDMKVGCTGCSYCMPCPYGVNIPASFQSYNSSYSDGWSRGIREYFMVTAFSRKPSFASLCTGCGACTSHCPQALPIPDLMKRVKRKLQIPGFGIARLYVKRRMLKDKDKD